MTVIRSYATRLRQKAFSSNRIALMELAAPPELVAVGVIAFVLVYAIVLSIFLRP